MKTETLKSFTDCPDPIPEVFVCKSLSDSVDISWDPPEDNNSPIIKYHIYLSDKIIRNIGSNDLSIEQENTAS